MLWENRFFFKELNFLLKEHKRVFLEIFYLKTSIVWRVPETVVSSQHEFINIGSTLACLSVISQKPSSSEGVLWVVSESRVPRVGNLSYHSVRYFSEVIIAIIWSCLARMIHELFGPSLYYRWVRKMSIPSPFSWKVMNFHFSSTKVKDSEKPVLDQPGALRVSSCKSFVWRELPQSA